MDERLRPSERLHTSSQYREIFHRGRCFVTPCLRIHYRPNGLEVSRLGLVVTRRVGNAVFRNQVKRRLREVFRRNKQRLPVPVDVVLLAQGVPRALHEYLEAFLAFALKVSAGRKGASS